MSPAPERISAFGGMLQATRGRFASPNAPVVQTRHVALVAAAALLTSAVTFVLVDRARLSTRISQRQSVYGTCLRNLTDRGAIARAAQAACGWKSLSAIRAGDLLGLPCFALAVVLFLALIFLSRDREPAVEPLDARNQASLD